MKKCIFLPFIVIFSSTCLWGQVFIGPKMGASLSRYTSLDSETDQKYYTTSFMPGFLGGITFEIPFNSTLSLQAEGYFVQKGSSVNRHSRENDTKYVCIHESLNYIEIPVLFKARIQGRPIGGFAFAGPAIGYGFGGNRRIGKPKSELEEKVTFGNNEEFDDYKNLDIGVQLGIGMSVELGFGELVLDGRLVQGLSQIGEVKSDYFNLEKIYQGDTKNQSLQVSIGLVFPIGG
jgi:hypothetical protein